MAGNDEECSNNTVAEREPKPETRRKWPYLVLAVVLAITAWNAMVTVPVYRALSAENSHSTIVYRRWLVSPSDIVFDVRKVDEDSSKADMDRLLFKSAEALKDRSFDRVILAYKGTGKLVLDGQHYQTIGETWQTQNPIYIIRTMQEHVTNLDGSPAFGTWTGGWLGVMGKQMEDHNELHDRWWVRDEAGLPDAPIDGL